MFAPRTQRLLLLNHHVMLTMRAIDDNGNWMNKSTTININGHKVPTVDWNEQHKAEQWRKKWAEYVNEYLEKHDHQQRIDHRSYKRQGKARAMGVLIIALDGSHEPPPPLFLKDVRALILGKKRRAI